MHLSLRRIPRRWAVVAALGVTVLASVGPATGVLAATPAGATPTQTPPWEPDADSVGGLIFYNAAGQVITGGSITASPLAAYVEGAAVVNPGDTRATLYGYVAQQGEPPGEFSGEQMSASTIYPDPSAPSPLDTSSLPVQTGAAGDETIQALMEDFPNNGTGAYADLYVLRLKTSAPLQNGHTTYDSADILVNTTTDTWSVVYGAVTPTLTTLRATPASPQPPGTSVTLTATVSPSGATGHVQFENGTTPIGSPVSLVGGTASTTTSSLPGGTDTLNTVFIPTSDNGTAGYSYSTGTTTYSLGTAVSGVTVAISPPSASSGAVTAYTVGFTTSSRGALPPGGTITLSLPVGTSLAELDPSPVTQGTATVGSCAATTTSVATCTISTSSVGSGTALTVDLEGVINPTPPGPHTLTVQTSADALAVTSPTYTVAPGTKVTGTSVAVSSTLTGATAVTYSVKLKATTGLSGAAGSTVMLTAPKGTGLGGLSGGKVAAGGITVGSCSATSSTVVHCAISAGSTVSAGSALVVTLPGLANPATTAAYGFKIATSSDTTSVTTTYCIAAAGVPCIATATPAKGAVGTVVTVSGINLAGATSVAFHGTPAAITTDTATKVTTAVPAGATTGTIAITTTAGTATSPKAFTVT